MPQISRVLNAVAMAQYIHHELNKMSDNDCIAFLTFIYESQMGITISKDLILENFDGIISINLITNTHREKFIHFSLDGCFWYIERYLYDGTKIVYHELVKRLRLDKIKNILIIEEAI